MEKKRRRKGEEEEEEEEEEGRRSSKPRSRGMELYGFVWISCLDICLWVVGCGL